jgi:hypothetical protein
VDDFNSAYDLSQRLRGRWFICPQSTNWGAPPSLDFELDDDAATYQFLVPNDAGSDFLPATTGDNTSGALLYLVFIGMEGADASPEAGDGAPPSDGSTELFVQWNDMTPRFNINLFFNRAKDNLEFVPDFTTAPRTLQLRELGGTPASALLVPVD